jgi:hypothetical protein
MVNIALSMLKRNWTQWKVYMNFMI